MAGGGYSSMGMPRPMSVPMGAQGGQQNFYAQSFMPRMGGYQNPYSLFQRPQYGSFGMYGWSNPYWQPQPVQQPNMPQPAGVVNGARTPQQIIADNKVAAEKAAAEKAANDKLYASAVWTDAAV